MSFLLFSNPGAQGGENSGMSSIFMLLAIVVIFYFFMIRPQMKRSKAEKQFRESLAKGQKIVTLGGLHGKIIEIKETSLIIEIANDVRVEIERSAIAVSVTKQMSK